MEISKMLTISTAHISQETVKFINNNNIASFSGEYAWIIYTKDNTEILPNDLKEAVRIANNKKCDWLRLDCDGEILNNLKQFEW